VPALRAADRLPSGRDRLAPGSPAPRALAAAGERCAATGFLPAAGVGASNTMRAAAGLADELSRADAVTVSLALELY
jgi:hypothetical protein